MVAPCGHVPGQMHPELEFTLCAPGLSGGLGVQDGPGRRVFFLLMQMTTIQSTLDE